MTTEKRPIPSNNLDTLSLLSNFLYDCSKVEIRAKGNKGNILVGPSLEVKALLEKHPELIPFYCKEKSLEKLQKDGETVIIPNTAVDSDKLKIFLDTLLSLEGKLPFRTIQQYIFLIPITLFKNNVRTFQQFYTEDLPKTLQGNPQKFVRFLQQIKDLPDSDQALDSLDTILSFASLFLFEDCEADVVEDIERQVKRVKEEVEILSKVSSLPTEVDKTDSSEAEILLESTDLSPTILPIKKTENITEMSIGSIKLKSKKNQLVRSLSPELRRIIELPSLVRFYIKLSNKYTNENKTTFSLKNSTVNFTLLNSLRETLEAIVSMIPAEKQFEYIQLVPFQIFSNDIDKLHNFYLKDLPNILSKRSLNSADLLTPFLEWFSVNRDIVGKVEESNPEEMLEVAQVFMETSPEIDKLIQEKEENKRLRKLAWEKRRVHKQSTPLETSTELEGSPESEFNSHSKAQQEQQEEVSTPTTSVTSIETKEILSITPFFIRILSRNAVYQNIFSANNIELEALLTAYISADQITRIAVESFIPLLSVGIITSTGDIDLIASKIRVSFTQEENLLTIIENNYQEIRTLCSLESVINFIEQYIDV